MGDWFTDRLLYSDVPLSRSHLAVSTKFFGGLSTSFLFALSRLLRLPGSAGADRYSDGVMELVRSIPGSRIGRATPDRCQRWATGKSLPIAHGAAAGSLRRLGLAFRLHTNPRPSLVARSNWAKTLYVFVLNKFYFDEIYNTFIVRPTLRLANWLWREIDMRGLDRLLHRIAKNSVLFARWLWQVVDVRGIDGAVVATGRQTVGLARWLWQMIDVRLVNRTVEQTGGQTVSLARWLWEAIDVRWVDRNVERIGLAANKTSHKLQEIEPRTLQGHLIVLILWLVIATVFFYWIVL